MIYKSNANYLYYLLYYGRIDDSKLKNCSG